MPSQKRRFGDWGENCAVEFLKNKGYRILNRNFLTKFGELDIVAAKVSGIFKSKIREIIFVEVKTAGPGIPLALAAQNVHFLKKRCLIRTAQLYLRTKKIPPEIPWRIDVVLVAPGEFGGAAKIEHLENAVF